MAVELGRRQQALRYLRAIPAAMGRCPNRGFVGRMTALARQQLDGLWLTGATFVSGSDGFELTGVAMSGDLVPIYLERLTNEPAIAGTRLQTIAIRQPKKPIGNPSRVRRLERGFAGWRGRTAPEPAAAAKARRDRREGLSALFARINRASLRERALLFVAALGCSRWCGTTSSWCP
jgi:hypothetical protein